MSSYALVSEYSLPSLPILVRHFNKNNDEHVVIMSALASGDLRVHPIKNHAQYAFSFWTNVLHQSNLDQVQWFTHFGLFSEEPSLGNWSIDYDEFSWHQFKLEQGHFKEITNQSLNQNQVEHLLGIPLQAIEV